MRRLERSSNQAGFVDFILIGCVRMTIELTLCHCALLLLIQEIFVNPSPFRSRQKVTDVKSDGLPKKEKKL